MQGRKILVTGSAGYIGSMLTLELLRQGCSVRGYDNLDYGGNGLLGVWSHPDFEFVRADVRDTAKLTAAVEGCDGIMHLAALVGDPLCAREPDIARAVNLDASVRLVEAAEKAGVGRMVFASTCSNYGKMADPESFVDETGELAPLSLYAKTKVGVEQEMLSRSSSDTCFTCLRFATVHGVSPRMRFDLTVNQFAMEMVTKKKLVVFGEQFWRPYVHVRDVARAVCTVLSADEDKVRGEVFNVGSTPENYTKQMITDLVMEAIPDGEVEYVHKDEDPRDYRVAFEKIARVLDFEITRTVPEGVREVAALVGSGVLVDPTADIYNNGNVVL